MFDKILYGFLTIMYFSILVGNMTNVIFSHGESHDIDVLYGMIGLIGMIVFLNEFRKLYEDE